MIAGRILPYDRSKVDIAFSRLKEDHLIDWTDKNMVARAYGYLDKLGGELNAFTTKEEIVLHATVLKEDLGKAAALLTTCGYRPERGADLFDEGLARWCKHAKLRYLGLHAARHMGYGTEFMTAEIAENTAEFAETIVKSL